MRRPFARAQLKGRIAGLVGPRANLVEPKASFVGPKATWFSENADYCSHARGKIEVGRTLTTNRSTGERHKVMSGRTLVLLSASALVGIACVVAAATDAFAQRRGGAAVARGGVKLRARRRQSRRSRCRLSRRARRACGGVGRRCCCRRRCCYGIWTLWTIWIWPIFRYARQLFRCALFRMVGLRVAQRPCLPARYLVDGPGRPAAYVPVG